MTCWANNAPAHLAKCILSLLLFVQTIHVVYGTTDTPFETRDLHQHVISLSQGVHHVIQQISTLIQQQEQLQEHFTQMSQRQETIERHISELFNSQNNNHEELTTLLHRQRDDDTNQNVEEKETISQTRKVMLQQTAECNGTGRYTDNVALAPEILGIKDDLSNVLVRTISLQSLILRLEDGRNKNEGRVEVFYNGEWGRVCSENWTDNNARVVCRQLGLPYENARAKSQAYFRTGSARFHFKDVICNGNENSLWSCRYDNNGDRCLSPGTVGVACHTIRLTNGSSVNEGRVEIWDRGQWKEVCGRSWDNNDAKVVCRQLHMPYEGAIASTANDFAHSTDMFKLQDFNCDGSEDNLLVCGHREMDILESCKHASVVCQPPVRLVGGLKDYEGIVEVWYNNEWGQICGEHWNVEDAMVVCKQLNLPSENAVVIPSLALNIRKYGDIKLAGVECSGKETDLMACNHRGWSGSLYCPGNSFATVACQPIRLVNGTSKYDGRVEIWRHSQWGSICDNEFDVKDTEVVCRHLRLSYEHTMTKPGAFFGEGNGPIWFHHVNCNGSESNITQCEHGELDVEECNHTRDVGVVCGSPVRLVGGIGDHEGRLEVWHDGEWGTVCQSYFGTRNGAVVCRELGLPYHNPEVLYNSYFGKGQGRVWMCSLDCEGYEDSLTSCIHKGWGVVLSHCDHTNDVGVRCESPIRLVNGSNAFEGRVEIWNHEKELWGTVSDSNWGRANAKVVCQQLGLSSDRVEIKTGAYFGKGTGPVWLHDVNCIGTESSLWACNTGIGEMNTDDHSRDVGVVCKSPIRLAEGDDKYKGRIEVWNGDSGWGFVCSESWNETAARVACRQLLLPFENLKSGSDLVFVDSDSVSEQAWFDLTECRGVEENVLSCWNNGWRNGECSFGFANVTCEAPIKVSDHGSADFFRAGRVLLWKGSESEWGAVSEADWDKNDAKVVCRELGFTDNAQPLRFTFDIETHHPSRGTTEQVWMTQVACNGTEEDIWSCPHIFDDTLADYSYRYDAGVKCESYNSRIRLVDGENERKGRVEVHLTQPSRYNDEYWTPTWGVVCKQKWDDTDAQVVCRELDLPFENAKARKIDYGQDGYSRYLFIYNVECTGMESNLLSCPHEQTDSNYCDRVAAVVCQ